MFFGGSPGTPTAPDTPTRRRTSKPLLNLHWDVLPPANIERTVWARSAAENAAQGSGGGWGGGEGARGRGGSVVVDDAEVEELEKLFSKTSAALSARERRSTFGGGGGAAGRGGRDVRGGAGGGRGRVKKVHLLDVSRGNNVAIGLKAFRRIGGVSDLAGLVGGLDPKGERAAFYDIFFSFSCYCSRVNPSPCAVDCKMGSTSPGVKDYLGR